MKNINQLLNAIKYKLRYGIIVEWYNMWYLILEKKQKVIPKVASIEETITKIINNRSSISRFGDGEILLIENKAIGFQSANLELSIRLKEILLSNEDNHLIGISDVFNDLYRYNRKARRFWRTHFYLYGYVWNRYLRKDYLYYNTFVTRPYMDFQSKQKCEEWFIMLKRIWCNRNIVFIEGEKSRLGVGNDLFSNAKSIRRILCPSENAFNKYDKIMLEATKLDKDSLILIALGPTATVLAYDLYLAGYQAIDAGHVDIEYEWWKMKARRKIKIPNKYVNENPNGKNIESSSDSEYNSQIICKIP